MLDTKINVQNAFYLFELWKTSWGCLGLVVLYEVVLPSAIG